jgi:hypothetical protein
MVPLPSARLDKLAPGLSARERAVLSVRATLLDEREDPRIRSTMPREQSVEFNRLICMANGVLHVLLPQALVLEQEVEALNLRYALLLTVAAWGLNQSSLEGALGIVAAMPIASSEYERLVEEGRATYVSLVEAAELLESNDEGEELRPEAAYRKAVRQLVERGQVKASGTGSKVSIQLGSMYDYLGIVHEPRTERGWRYEVLPDQEYRLHRWRGELAERAVSRGQIAPSLPPGPSLTSDLTVAGSPLDELRTALAVRVKAELSLRWSQLLALETVAAEVVERFQDEVVIPEAMRSLLTRVREDLTRLYEGGVDLLELQPLPDADESFVELLRRGLKRDALLYV